MNAPRAAACAVLATLVAGCAATDDAGRRSAEIDSSAPVATDQRIPLAMRLFEEGRDEQARAIVDDILVRDPNHPRADVALFIAAECRLRSGRLDEAYQQYVRLIERHPASRVTRAVPARLYRLGVLLLEREPATLIEQLAPSFALAIDAFSRVAIDFPGSEWSDDAWMKLGEAHLKEGRPDYAALAFDRLARERRDSEFAEEACWRVAPALERKSRDAKCDVIPLADARRAAVRYLKRYGEHGRFAAEAGALIRTTTERLADHERSIAAFYARGGNGPAAALHTNNADRLLGSDPDGPDSLDLLRERFDRPPWERDRPLPPLLDD